MQTLESPGAAWRDVRQVGGGQVKRPDDAAIDRAWLLLELAQTALRSETWEMRSFMAGKIEDFLEGYTWSQPKEPAK